MGEVNDSVEDDCPDCDGTGYVVCEFCDGSGKVAKEYKRAVMDYEARIEQREGYGK